MVPSLSPFKSCETRGKAGGRGGSDTRHWLDMAGERERDTSREDWEGKAAGVCAVGEDGKRPVPWCLPVPGPRPGLDVPLQLVSPSEKEEGKEEILYWGVSKSGCIVNLHPTPPNVSGVSRAGGERDF